jgi:hypothetical protein
MLAHGETPRLLGRALFRYTLTSRFYLLQVAVLLVVALLTFFVFRSPLSAAVLAAVVVLAPVTLYVRCVRGARAFAPPGFTLGLGVGTTHLAVRHAVATTITPYVNWHSVERRGEAVVLRTRRGGVLPLPAELVSPALAQLQALITAAASPSPTGLAGTADAPAPPQPREMPLAYAFECTAATRGQLTRGATVRQLLAPGMLTLATLDLLLLVSPVVLEGLPWFWAVVPAAATVALVALGGWTSWRRLAASASPGMVIRAGVRDDALELEDATGRATISYRSVERIHVMRHAVLVRSQLRSIVLFPRAVLPEAETRRAQGAVEWLRSRR